METSATDIDASALAAAQRQQWDDAATGWKKWADWLERTTGPVSARLLDLAGVQSGSRVLDVATGPGEPALTAARRVGPTGSVVATDQAPRMLAVGRERAAAAGLTNIEFMEVDGEALDVPSESFDAAVCRWGLMFLPRPERAVTAMRDALRSGGRIAVSTWGPPPRVPLLSLAMGVLVRELSLPPPAPGPGPFGLADPEQLRALLTDNGFEGVQVEPFTVGFTYRSAEEFVESTRDLAAPVTASIDAQPAERRPALWEAIEAAVAPFTDAGGAVTLPSEALLASAHRP